MKSNRKNGRRTQGATPKKGLGASYLCDDCQTPGRIEAGELFRASKPRCFNCGSTRLIPATKMPKQPSFDGTRPSRSSQDVSTSHMHTGSSPRPQEHMRKRNTT